MNKFISSARIFACVPALFLGATAAASASDLQNQAVALHYVTCLAHAADKFDDGVSDPSVIAARITPLCSDEFVREVKAFSGGMSDNDKAAYRAAVTVDQPALVASIVVNERKYNARHGKERVAQSN